MTTDQIIQALTLPVDFPVDALRAASRHRKELVPRFVAAFEDYLAADDATRRKPNPLFFAFHLLGSWRETSAYPVLTKFLHLPAADIELVLGEDAIVGTVHRVIASVYDGDPKPIQSIVLEERADEIVRGRMCEALAMLVLHNMLPRAAAAEFLGRAFELIRPRDKSQIWFGWKNAIAMLGLIELKPLVREAFQHNFIDSDLGTFRQFEEEEIAYRPDASLRWMDDDYSLFGDVVDELSAWDEWRPH